MKIRTKLIALMTVSAVISTTLFIMSTVTSYNQHLQEHIKELKREAYQNKKEELNNYSQMAIKVIDSYYKRTLNTKNKKDLTYRMQKEALRAIKNMRYGKNGYFWINDMDNKMLMHPIKPQYDNKIFINTPKVPFVQLGTEKLKRLGVDKTFISYSFYTPATKKYSHKLSIVEQFKPWHWMIGTGVYTDYLDIKIKKEKEIAQKEMKDKIYKIIVITIILVILMVFFMIIFMDKIINTPLKDFQKGLSKFFQYLDDDSVKLDKLSNTSNDEIGIISQQTNEAIQIAVKTHQELIDLRKQLEDKVKETTQNLDKTQKDFNEVTQNTEESLAYGALILNSIIPDKTRLDQAFSDNFIFDVQTKTVNSQFYICEEINTNEYIYFLIDTKEKGISAVFTTMLINAMVKQSINQLKYDEVKDISTAWILEYLNNNIELSNNGCDCAVIYHNKNKNIIKYSGVNFPLHYFQDDTIHIIKPDIKKLGVKKDIKIQEHIIEVKEYLEFYLSTKHYIKDFIDVYDFKSPFLTSVNNFKNHLTDIHEDVIVCGFQIDNKPKIIVEYKGEFTQNLVQKYMEKIEDNIENMGLMSNVSTNFVEQFQNILNYGKSEDKDNNDITPIGSIILRKNSDETYSIESSNIITASDKQKIEPKLFEIESLDRNGLRKRYRELRKSGENTHKKGGGVGFYEIAKRSSKIEYNFIQINEERFEFRFISYISISKK